MKKFLCAFLLTLAVAFAGCEPAGNSGNSGSNGNGGNGSTPDTSNPDPTDPTKPETTDPANPDTSNPTTGKWDLAKWQAWSDAGNSTPPSESLTAFIDWANQYFPNGIPKSPQNKGTAWDAAEWTQYFTEHAETKEKFPGNWNNFLLWAMRVFPSADMPNTPPTGTNWQPYEIVDGPWKLADWQRWTDSAESKDGIPGISSLTAFINWANTNFKDGIPHSPAGSNTGTGWDATEWNLWFTQHPDAKFPDPYSGNMITGWSEFRRWADDLYNGGDMPNTPPQGTVTTKSGGDNTQALVNRAAEKPAEIINETIQRTLEDAGMNVVE